MLTRLDSAVNGKRIIDRKWLVLIERDREMQRDGIPAACMGGEDCSACWGCEGCSERCG